MNKIMFSKEEKSTFKYWFAHWCAFQMTALNLHCWKWRFLLHDMEKPWLKLILPYSKVKKFHREHSAHHTEYKGSNFDYLGMVIDWECSRFTKTSAPWDACETLYNHFEYLIPQIVPILKELGIFHHFETEMQEFFNEIEDKFGEKIISWEVHECLAENDITYKVIVSKELYDKEEFAEMCYNFSQNIYKNRYYIESIYFVTPED
jgi:hypothetical protein